MTMMTMTVCVFGHGLMPSSYGNWRLRLGRLNIMGHGSTRTMDVAVNTMDFVVLSWRAQPHDTHILFVIMERDSVHEACHLTGYFCLSVGLHPILYDTHTKSCINTHKLTPAHHRFGRRRIAKHYAFFQSGIQLGHPSGSHPVKRYTSTESEKRIDWN